MRMTPVLLIGVLLGGQLAAAQDPAAPVRRLSVSITGSGSFGGPVAGIARQLPARGFGDTQPLGCFFVFCAGPRDYPQVYDGFGGAGLGIRYELGERWAISGSLATADFGAAAGYRATQGGVHVHSAWEATAVWAAAHVEPVDRLSFGGGLSVHRFRGGDPGAAGLQSVTRAGLTAEAAVRLPNASRFFWEVTLRGHWLPGTTDVTHSTAFGPMILPVRWSYATLGTGVGIRL